MRTIAWIAAAVTWGLLAYPGFSQGITEERLRQLELETQRLKAEIEAMQQSQPIALPPIRVDQTGFVAAPQAAAQTPSMDEIRAEMKKLAWTKGDIQIVPYGYLWATTSYESSRSQVGDYVLYVLSSTDQGESAWHVDAKSTRLGIDFLGPMLPNFGCAQTGGKVEIDFQGQYQTENKATVLLRHAYLEVKNENFRLLAGQTWDVISPLLPGTIMYSVGWGAGNLGYRRAQFRAERYFHFSDRFLVTAQASINSDIVSEFAGNVIGDHADWPVVEGRLAFTLGPRGKGCRPLEFGISGHIGEQVYDFLAAPAEDDVEFRTWSFNVDVKWPITSRLGVQGEFFTGENLGAYLGGIVQGVNLTRRDTICSTGGWFDVWYDWTSRLHSHAGYSIDDPFNEDLSSGQRSYNQFYYVNLTYDATKKFVLGVEVQQWKTNWVDKEPGDSYRLELMAKYGF
ncbi:MAG: hypothetical protein ACUVQH_08100 [Thermogutta sp.]